MPNTLTDQLEMVSETTVKGGRWLFPPAVRQDFGFSLQVFSPAGQYRGSLDGPSDRRRLHDGDTILRVNLGQNYLRFEGELHTSDAHTRKYEATITVQVSDARTFAICYRQRTDPVARLRDSIHRGLNSWAQTVQHDSIDGPNLRYHAERAAALIGPQIGLRLAYPPSIRANLAPYRQELSENRQQAKTAPDLHQGHEQADQLHEIQLDVQSRLVNITISALIDRYRQLLEDGLTPEQIGEKYPQLVSGISATLPLVPRTSQQQSAGDAIQFTAFHPPVVPIATWRTLLVYAHVVSALNAVRADAGRFDEEAEIGDRPHSAQASAPQRLARGTDLTIIPTCEGVTFNPEYTTIKWLEDWHRIPFRFLADGAFAGSAMNGEVNIYASHALNIATIKLAFICEADRPAAPALARSGQSSEETSPAEVTADLYGSIFASYSHEDTGVVTACRNAYHALGLQVNIDADSLRAGDTWHLKLLELIDTSDVFQLFWSARSAQSEYVQREWQYAVDHSKGPGFIRPVYWERPLVTPPAALSMLHFAYVPLPKQDQASS